MNTSTVCLRIVKSLSRAHWKSVVVGLALLTGEFASDGARAQDVNLGEFSASDGFVLTGNNPNSYASGVGMHAGDFNGDGFADVVIGSPITDGVSFSYLYFGGPTESGTFNLETVKESPSPRAISFRDHQFYIGFDVDTAGDFNGDGYDDILLTSRSNAAAYIIFGGPGPHVNRNLATFNAASPWGVKFTYHPHKRLPRGRGIGDINNDGYDDILIATNESFGGYAYNNSWVIFGGPDKQGIVDLIDFQTSDANGFMFPGQDLENFAPIGDFNGDGFADFAVFLGGRAHIYFGKASGYADVYWPWTMGSIIQSIYSFSSIAIFPTGTLGVTSDFNGDGKSDIVMAFRGPHESGGFAYVVYGTDDEGIINVADIPGDSSIGFQIVGAPGDEIGRAGTFLGDINGDGFADISLDSPGFPVGTHDKSGSSYVIYGTDNMPATLNLETNYVSGVTGFRVTSTRVGDAEYYYSAAAGDVNNDGLDDMMFMSGWYDPSPGRPVGYSYVLYGRADAGVSDWQLWEP